MMLKIPRTLLQSDRSPPLANKDVIKTSAVDAVGRPSQQMANTCDRHTSMNNESGKDHLA